MDKKDLDNALLQFEKDFGFSFTSLIGDPDKYQQRIKEMEKEPSPADDTKHFCNLYDDAQIKAYAK